MDERMTILVVSYDGYSDMWPGFFTCLRKYWPDCPYEVVLANNEKACPDSSARVVNCGAAAQWSTRTRMALDKINTRYVCFLLEDFYISESVDKQRIRQALDFMEEERINYYKLLSFSKIRTDVYPKGTGLQILPAGLPYGISLLAAIWEKDFFLSMIGEEDYNPWLFEARRIEEAEKEVDKNRIVGVYDSTNPLKICHMAVQGKYLPRSVDLMRKQGIEIDTANRPVLRGKEYSRYMIKKWGTKMAARFPIIKRIAVRMGFESVSSRNLRQHKDQ